jgi:DNA-directed RNA polymerase specialized sigma24 family protein
MNEQLAYAETEEAAEAFILAAHGFPLSEYQISDLLGISRARIWQLHQRALRKLLRALEVDGCRERDVYDTWDE